MDKRWRLDRGEGLMLVVLSAISALIFALPISRIMYGDPNSDYAKHIAFARDILERQQFATAHVLYQALILAVSALFHLPLELSGLIVVVIFYAGTAALLYLLMRTVVNGSGWRSRLLTAGGALALLLVTPITLLTLPQANLYFGYVGINVLHNPTMVLLKPFALLLSTFTVAVLEQRASSNVRTIAAGFLLAFLSVFAKPNFALILLPALLLIAAYRLARRQPLDLKTLIAALILPLIVFLALDYVGQYFLVDADGGGILFAPLLTIYAFDPQIALLPLKFLLSILFPLAVTLLYRQQAFRDLRLQLAWLMFGIGAAQMYLFAEGGNRLRDGNFWWSAQIGLFVLFVVSALFWLGHFHDQPGWRGRVCLVIFLLHLLSGIVFYAVQFSSGSMSTWW